MGIKGIYGEIGPGDRIALSKLAVEKLEQTGRPIRIAIDISIWQFQIQASRGGSDPATRTLYYRLQRLLAHGIQPLFVFDGPYRPAVKRNKHTGAGSGSVSNGLTKKLLSLFGFPYHTAPGEAEAECALFQRSGIVDAVLSEDVDTLMFGSTLTFRSWSSEGSRGNKSPTHVNVYDSKATKAGRSGLDREGMILVALMSGGDYNTAGIPGCGIKVACEAARAGFGTSLCRIARSDALGYEKWRVSLAHEINTNESKYFRTKHTTLKIPEDFPNRELLGLYTHPVVSTVSKVSRMKEDIIWDGEVDIPGLRDFVADAFEWTYRTGCRKFIRGIAPALLVHKLLSRANRRDSEYGDLILTAMNETELVRAVCGSRQHFSTDATPELRLVFIPIDLVGLNLEDEEESPDVEYGRDGLAPLNDADEIEEYASEVEASRSASPTKRAASTFDPTEPDKVWVPHTVAKVGVPLKVEDYEESLRNPKKFIRAKTAGKKAAAKKGGMPKGALDRFVQVTKAIQNDETVASAFQAQTRPPDFSDIRLGNFEPICLQAQSQVDIGTDRVLNGAAQQRDTLPRSSSTYQITKASILKAKSIKTTRRRANPWNIAASPGSASKTVQITKPIAAQCILSSSPPSEQSAESRASPALKYTRSTSPSPLSSSSPPSPPPGLDFELPASIRVTRGNRSDPSPYLVTPTKPIQIKPSPRRRPSPDLPAQIRYQGSTAPLTSNASPPSSSPLLPITNPSKPVHEIINLDSSPLPPIQVLTRTQDHEAVSQIKKKIFVARESLPGTFKEVEDDAEEVMKSELGKSEDGGNREVRKREAGRWRKSQVELVDLTDV